MFWEKLKRILKVFCIVILFLLVISFSYFFLTNPKPASKITWGVNFSQQQASDLGLDWKQTYTAILDDLKARYLKISAQWDLVEPENGNYNFADLDWQIQEAQKRGAQILLVVGMKTPRWPECHIPEWADKLTKEQQQKNILDYIQKTISRYQDSDAIWAWQVENEPFFQFGQCPWSDKDFLIKEIALVKSLDEKKRPVVISDTGEMSLWLGVAKYGDMVATTLYRKVWLNDFGFSASYPFPPNFYWRKAQIIEKLFHKKVIVGELQAEPWGRVLIQYLPLDEQLKSMNLNQFQSNIDFAKNTGLDEFYLWGTEWWYYMKEKQGHPEIWQEAKKLFAIDNI